MNAYDIEIEYDQENDYYYAEHEFTYPSKRVRLNIDTDNSSWPTDESNSMTITIPSNPQTDTNNTWDDTTKTLTLTNLDQNTLITNNQNPTFNYATDLNINLLNYQPVKASVSRIELNTIIIANESYNEHWIYYENGGSVSPNRDEELLIIEYLQNTYNVYYLYAYNSTGGSYRSTNKFWCYKYNLGVLNTYSAGFFDNNGNLLFSVKDNISGNSNMGNAEISKDLINFSGISWLDL